MLTNRALTHMCVITTGGVFDESRASCGGTSGGPGTFLTATIDVGTGCITRYD